MIRDIPSIDLKLLRTWNFRTRDYWTTSFNSPYHFQTN